MSKELVFNLLVREAELRGTAAVKAACREFLRRRTQRTVGAAKEKRRPVPRKWIETAFIGQRGICAWCKQEMSLSEATGDHIVSLNTGGKHHQRNIQALHRSCNSSKSDKDLLEQSKATGRGFVELLGGGSRDEVER